MRPSLGQPTSPIRISLPAKACSQLRPDLLDMRDRVLGRDRIILPIGQDMDGHEVGRRGELWRFQPELPDIGVGHGKSRAGAHLLNVALDGRGRQLARSSTSLPTMNASITPGCWRASLTAASISRRFSARFRLSQMPWSTFSPSCPANFAILPCGPIAE